MYFLIIFSFLSCVASNEMQTIIVHMPGVLDGGFQFLYSLYHISKFPKRYFQELNSSKSVIDCPIFNKVYWYESNLPVKNMDLGGPQCISFYKNMILDAHNQFPHANIILLGASQGSASLLGAVADLASERHRVIEKIKKIVIQALLGPAQEVINANVSKYRLCKPIVNYFPSIMPLLAEYVFCF